MVKEISLSRIFRQIAPCQDRAGPDENAGTFVMDSPGSLDVNNFESFDITQTLAWRTASSAEMTTDPLLICRRFIY